MSHFVPQLDEVTHTLYTIYFMHIFSLNVWFSRNIFLVKVFWTKLLTYPQILASNAKAYGPASAKSEAISSHVWGFRKAVPANAASPSDTLK